MGVGNGAIVAKYPDGQPQRHISYVLTDKLSKCHMFIEMFSIALFAIVSMIRTIYLANNINVRECVLKAIDVIGGVSCVSFEERSSRIARRNDGYIVFDLSNEPKSPKSTFFRYKCARKIYVTFAVFVRHSSA